MSKKLFFIIHTCFWPLDLLRNNVSRCTCIMRKLLMKHCLEKEQYIFKSLLCSSLSFFFTYKYLDFSFFFSCKAPWWNINNRPKFTCFDIDHAPLSETRTSLYNLTVLYSLHYCLLHYGGWTRSHSAAIHVRILHKWSFIWDFHYQMMACWITNSYQTMALIVHL